jgi:dehydrogenase E1 component/transketolase-like protein
MERAEPAAAPPLLEMYQAMVLVREVEQALVRLFAENRVPGFLHSYIGEEATAVGVCSALRAEDYITSTHRGHGHIVAKGADLGRFFAEIFGKEAGYCKGKGGSMHVADARLGILGANGIVGGGIPIAAGAALAAKLRGLDRVAVSFFGGEVTTRATRRRTGSPATGTAVASPAAGRPANGTRSSSPAPGSPSAANWMRRPTQLGSVARTGRLVVAHQAHRRGGFGAEIVATVAERRPGGRAPAVTRAAGLDVPVPFSPALEEFALPDAARIVAAVRRTG